MLQVELKQRNEDVPTVHRLSNENSKMSRVVVRKVTSDADALSFVFVGDLIEGHVEPGMKLRVMWHPGLIMVQPIIAAVRPNSFPHVVGSIELHLRCRDQEEFELLEFASIQEGEQFDVVHD